MFCANKYLAHVIFAAVVAGSLLGVMLVGWLGDHFGRLKTLRYILLFSVVGQFLILFAATPVYYAIVNFFVALTLAPLVVMPLVWLCEMTDNTSRGLFMSCGVICLILGEVIVPLCRMFVGSWRQLVIFDVSVGCIAYLLTFTLPESFRYFAGVKRRFIKARTVLNGIAEANGFPTFEEKLQGEEQNEYNATGGLEESDSRNISGTPGSNDISRNVIVAPPGEYMGYAEDVDEREKELAHLQEPKVSDLCMLRSLRTSLIVSLCLSLGLGVLTAMMASFPSENSFASSGAGFFGLLTASLLTFCFGRRAAALVGNLLITVLAVLAACLISELGEPEKGSLVLSFALYCSVLLWLLVIIEGCSTSLRCHMLAINIICVVLASTLAFFAIASYTRAVFLSGVQLLSTLALVKMRGSNNRALLDSPDDSKVLSSQFVTPPVRGRVFNQSIEMAVELNSEKES